MKRFAVVSILALIMMFSVASSAMAHTGTTIVSTGKYGIFRTGGGTNPYYFGSYPGRLRTTSGVGIPNRRINISVIVNGVTKGYDSTTTNSSGYFTANTGRFIRSGNVGKEFMLKVSFPGDGAYSGSYRQAIGQLY